ncbi:MAG: Foldase protein PrsA precursor [Syntrophorhabdaceae bacterium PtaU1.Bin034]|nr:MAG: Foldase protein PrsA precursor [Syntrophorhabdaceae bacterium PtaU1.Bin034]
MRLSGTIGTALIIATLSTVGMASPGGAATQKAAVPAPATAEKKAGIIATVNGSDIAVEDFDAGLNRAQRLALQTGKPLTCAQISRLRGEVVEELVRREILYQESRKSVKVTEAEINEELKKLKGRYASETDFANALAAMKVSPSTLRAQVERALSIQKFIESQFASKAVITDKDIWAYYDRNRESFRQPEQVRASHILIKAEPGWDAGKKGAARKKIEEIRQKIQQKQDFESLARTYSEDPSASKGGDLGYIRTGQVLKPFEEALFVLKPGEVSDIVETSLGYHLIKASDRKPETTVPFENVKDQLRTLLKQEKGRQEASAHIGKLREKAKVAIFLPSE